MSSGAILAPLFLRDGVLGVTTNKLHLAVQMRCLREQVSLFHLAERKNKCRLLKMPEGHGRGGDMSQPSRVAMAALEGCDISHRPGPHHSPA